MTSIPGGPTYYRADKHGRAVLGFGDGREVDLARPVRLTTYLGTKVEGQLSNPINIIYTHNATVTYCLYFEDGIEARWRPGYGETLEQAES